MAYTLSDVLCLLSRVVTVHRLDYWLRLGVIIPFKGTTSSGDPRLFSDQNVIEAGLAEFLVSNGLTAKQLQVIFANLRAAVAPLPPSLRASAVFIRYVEMVEAIVAINGPGQNYEAWRAGVAPYVRRWKRKPAPLDADILSMLATPYRLSADGYPDGRH